MTTGDALAAGFEALITGVTVYKDRVPSSPSFPYVFVLTNFPTVSERSLARTQAASMLTSRTIVCGATAASVRIIAQKLATCLEGQRLTVTGWTLGAIESVPNDQRIQPDLDVTLPGSAENPLYQPFDWVLVGSRTP